MWLQRIIIVWVSCLLLLQAKADHITGGEIYYTYVNNQAGLNTYVVTMKLFMRCNSGRSFPDPAVISVFDRLTFTRVTDVSVNIARRETIRLDTVDPCISNPPTVCYEIAYYEFTLSVPPNENGYIISGQVNFRIARISNLVNGSSGVGATYTAEIPGMRGFSTATRNNSATFTANDLVIVCAGNPFTYSFAAREIDEDQISYSFCNAYQTGTSSGGQQTQQPPVAPPYPAVPYGNGFDGTAPLGPLVSIDPATGEISGIAPEPGVYVVTVCVTERRSGIIIATQRKDIQINVTNCSIAAARLPGEIMLCRDTTYLRQENGSNSSLIQRYEWSVLNREGTTIHETTQPVLEYTFRDTGQYRVRLLTNRGIACPDSATSVVRVYPGQRTAAQIAGTCIGRPTEFRDRSTTRYGSITAWRWNFGEATSLGDTAITAVANYIYPEIGNKVVQLVSINTNGCKDTASIPWEITSRPQIMPAFKDTLICLPDTLTLQVNGQGIVSWVNLTAQVGGTNILPRVAPQATTSYVVNLDQDGCFNTDTITVRVTDRVTLTTPPDTTICAGDATPLRAITNATSIQWQPAALFDNPGINTPIANVTNTTTVLVTGRVSRCVATSQFVVRPVPYPTADAGEGGGLCATSAGLQLSATTSSTTNLQWSPAEGLSNNRIPNPIARPTTTTTYTLQVFENNGCPKPGVDTITIQVAQPIVLNTPRDTSVVIGQPLELRVSGATTYLWSPADGLSNPRLSNPLVTYNQPRENVTLRVTGYNNGCEATETIRVRVFAGPAVYVPTAFTPNGDGLNDVLKPTLAGMQRLVFFRLYNRYGQLIYETGQEGSGWNGTFNGQLQPATNYVWAVQAVDYKGETYVQKGTVMLIR